MKSAKAFIKALQNSQELQATLSNADWSVDSVVSAGAKHGFNFTSDEYRGAYAELAKEELAAVTGGLRAVEDTCAAAWKGTTGAW